MNTYKIFVAKLFKNYLLGSAMAIFGVFIGLNMAAYQITLQEMYVLFVILAISIFFMSFFEYYTFRNYMKPIKAALTRPTPSLELLKEAYLQAHRLPSLSGFRILGPRFIGITVPICLQMVLAIYLEYLHLPLIYISFAAIGIVIIIGVHAMIEFFLTSNAIQPVITELKLIAKNNYHFRLSLNGKMLVSIRTKLLISSFLIGAFPLVLFSLATQIQLESLTGRFSESYWVWGLISLLLSFLLGAYGAWLLYSYISSPLKQLNEKMCEIKVGNLEVEAHDYYSDEFSKVISGFNHMVRGLKQKDEANQQLIESFIITLATILDAKDNYTAGHSVRVANYAVEIGKKIGLSKEDLSILKKSALLHDIGKIGVPDEVLLKKSELTKEEFEKIKTHSIIGEGILLKIEPQEMIKPLLPGIRSHHERIDGKGYPDQLTGEAIPLFGRIIAVADAYDAMTSNRPYRMGMQVKQAVAILLEGRGSQWEGKFVDAFVEWLDETEQEETLDFSEII